MLVFKFCYSNFASSRYYDWIKNSTNATCDTIPPEITTTTSQHNTNNLKNLELGALIGFVILFVCLTAFYLIYIYIEQRNKNRITVEPSIRSSDRNTSTVDVGKLEQQSNEILFIRLQSDKQPDKLVKSKSSKDKSTSQKVKSISTKILKQKSIGKIKVNLPLKAVKKNFPKN